MAYSTPTTRADGFVVDAARWNQDVVSNIIALRTGAIQIASQAANDVFYASSASQLGRLAAGTAGKVLQSNGSASAPSYETPFGMATVNGRLTLTTGTPVTSADVTAAATLYWALYGGNQIALYNATYWQAFTVAQLSIAAPAVANQMYDVFVQYNAGTPQLALVAWTNDTTRATALTTQDGVLVKTGATGDRYVGSVRTVTASQFNDAFLLRHVWNYYHQKPRAMRCIETANTWTYSVAAWQQARASAANQVSFVIGVAEVPVDLELVGFSDNDGGGSHFAVGIGLDTVAAPTTGNTGMKMYSVAAGTQTPAWARLRAFPAVGYHYAAWLEYAITATGITTWYGDNNTPTLTQAGISGSVLG